MIDKKEERRSSKPKVDSVHDFTDITATILVQSQQLLDLKYCQVQSNIRAAFERLSESLQSREKQLLRQLDVLQSQQIALLQSHNTFTNSHCLDLPNSIPQVQVDLQQEQALCESIMTFGNVKVEGGNLASINNPYAPPYRVEDYQDANEDHVSLFKPLSNVSSPQDVIKFSFRPQLKSVSHQEVNENKLIDSDIIMKIDANYKCASPPQMSMCNLECNGESPHVQQWLQQIMAETETEPAVVELEKQFCTISTMDSSLS